MPPGCLALVVLFGLLFLVPFLFAQLMAAAIGIFLRGAINIPVKRQ